MSTAAASARAMRLRVFAQTHAAMGALPSMCTALTHTITCFRQGTWCVPQYVESGRRLSSRRFSLVFLRAFRAGCEHRLVSWCTCSGRASVAEVLFREQARLVHRLSPLLQRRLVLTTVFNAAGTDRHFSEVAGGLQPCQCATALCVALRTALHDGELWQRCDEDTLAALLHPDNIAAPEPPYVSDDGVLRVHISVCGEDLLAVRLADRSWGLVANYTPMAARRLRCLLCRKSHCPHMSALDAGRVGAGAGYCPPERPDAARKRLPATR